MLYLWLTEYCNTYDTLSRVKAVCLSVVCIMLTFNVLGFYLRVANITSVFGLQSKSLCRLLSLAKNILTCYLLYEMCSKNNGCLFSTLPPALKDCDAQSLARNLLQD